MQKKENPPKKQIQFFSGELLSLNSKIRTPPLVTNCLEALKQMYPPRDPFPC